MGLVSKIPARFVTLIPREFPASQVGRAASTTGATTNKRKSSTASSASSSKRRQSSPDNGAGLFDISMDFGGGLGEFDALDLDFDKPLDEHEQEAVQGNFSPF